MSQVTSTYNLVESQEPISQVIKTISPQETIILSIVGVALESIPTRRVNPVQIVDGVIRVDEDQMDEGEPYAFQYLGKYHMLARRNGKLRLYELR